MITILQIWCGELPPRQAERAQYMLAWCRARGWQHQLVNLRQVDDPQAATVASDNARYAMLASAPGMVYCDLDCRLTDRFEHIADAQPHHGFFPAVSRPECISQPDGFLCYGPCEFYSELLRLRDKRWPIGAPYCWPRKLLRDDHRVQQIPADWYEHSMDTVMLGRTRPLIDR